MMGCYENKSMNAIEYFRSIGFVVMNETRYFILFRYTLGWLPYLNGYLYFYKSDGSCKMSHCWTPEPNEGVIRGVEMLKKEYVGENYDQISKKEENAGHG